MGFGAMIHCDQCRICILTYSGWRITCQRCSN